MHIEKKKGFGFTYTLIQVAWVFLSQTPLKMPEALQPTGHCKARYALYEAAGLHVLAHFSAPASKMGFC